MKLLKLRKIYRIFEIFSNSSIIYNIYQFNNHSDNMLIEIENDKSIDFQFDKSIYSISNKESIIRFSNFRNSSKLNKRDIFLKFHIEKYLPYKLFDEIEINQIRNQNF